MLIIEKAEHIEKKAFQCVIPRSLTLEVMLAKTQGHLNFICNSEINRSVISDESCHNFQTNWHTIYFLTVISKNTNLDFHVFNLPEFQKNYTYIFTIFWKLHHAFLFYIFANFFCNL